MFGVFPRGRDPGCRVRTRGKERRLMGKDTAGPGTEFTTPMWGSLEGWGAKECQRLEERVGSRVLLPFARRTRRGGVDPGAVDRSRTSPAKYPSQHLCLPSSPAKISPLRPSEPAPRRSGPSFAPLTGRVACEGWTIDFASALVGSSAFHRSVTSIGRPSLLRHPSTSPPELAISTNACPWALGDLTIAPVLRSGVTSRTCVRLDGHTVLRNALA